jgi:integrase
MGSVHIRGTRDRPRVYLSFKTGSKADGSPNYVMRAFKGLRTKKEAQKELARIELAISRGEPWEVDSGPQDDMGTLLDRWAAGLTNRAAYEDKLITKRDLVPRFRGYVVGDVTVRVVLEYLAELAKTDMATQTQRHRLTLLSRFFAWAIESEITDTNPCLMVPRGRRPSAKREKETLFLDDDSKIPDIMAGLGPNLGLIYYIARFSGLREGEAAGLRMSDLDYLADELIRVRFSFNGELKESKHGSKPVKWAPAPVDAADVLGLHVKRRKLQGAKDDDLVFLFQAPPKGRGKGRTSSWKEWAGWHPKNIRMTWRRVADDLKLPKELTFYGATRHTFTTKALKAGAALDEVSAAIGHADPQTTKRFYDHLVRREFAPALRQGLNGALRVATAGTEGGGRP